MIFAAEYMPPAATDSFLAVLMYLCVIVAAVAVAWRSIFPLEDKSTPQPLIVSPQQRMATHEEVVQLRNEFEDFKSEQRDANDSLRATIEEAVKTINETGERRITSVHERINQVAVTVGEIRGELRHKGGA